MHLGAAPPRIARWLFVSLAFSHSLLAQADVSALGRLEPRDGIRHVTAPVTPESATGVVLGELRVDAGDRVAAGQVIAVTESAPLLRSLLDEALVSVDLAERESRAAAASADAACVRAESARREADRRGSLLERSLSSQEEFERASATAAFEAAGCEAARAQADAAAGAIALAEARVARQRAALERSIVRSPVDGLVLAVRTWPGELVGRSGIVEIGEVDHMYAIAEVYETDVAQVAVGQRARVTSDALAAPLSGVVEHVRLQVRKQDVLDTDPAARKDARIVEVEIRLDGADAASSLSNLQVEVVIET
jgi:HlyD family secretion protein